MKLYAWLLALLLPVLNSCAQPRTGTTPLTIGDTIPHIILTDVANFPVSEIQLSSKTNQLTIIDFWGSYCAPCIQALPKYDSLQQLFKDSVRIITVSDFSTAKEFYAAKQKFSPLQKMKLPVLLQNNPLKAMFPHKLISHIVWIGPYGVVRAITGGEQVTAGNIRSLLHNDPINWPVKRDMVDFDYRKPLLAIAQPVEPPAQLYYSTFTSAIEGIAPPSGTETDPETGDSFTAFYNYGLLALCQLAVDYRTDALREQFDLRVKDSSRFVCDNPSQLQAWKKQNTWCYYLRLPGGNSQKRTDELVKADLLRWLSVMGIAVTKELRKNGDKVVETYVINELTH